MCVCVCVCVRVCVCSYPHCGACCRASGRPWANARREGWRTAEHRRTCVTSYVEICATLSVCVCQYRCIYITWWHNLKVVLTSASIMTHDSRVNSTAANTALTWCVRVVVNDVYSTKVLSLNRPWRS